MSGAQYDILNLGGVDASSTVISPKMLDEFVIHYDGRRIEIARKAEQGNVCHTCGGMMPILEQIASMKPEAVETFIPVEMGGDTHLEEACRQEGRICPGPVRSFL